jgi:diadenosine tetraphosphate (Ap4A) HIT family hydrolase
VAKQLGIVECGYRLLMNVGSGAGQEVPHLHVHILSNKK